MTVEQLRASHKAQPFRPSLIHLDHGGAVLAHRREFLMVAPIGRTISVYQPDDTLNTIDLLLVTDLKVRRAANGSSRRRKMKVMRDSMSPVPSRARPSRNPAG